jgi:hypothetical protein
MKPKCKANLTNLVTIRRFKLWLIYIMISILLLERMGERRLTKEIYEADVGINAGRGRPRRAFLDQIGEVLETTQVKSTRNRRACIRNSMTVEEAKGVSKDRSKWKKVISAYPKGKRA